jgi:photosystem II stability/assembly factor-like uncharacterized protein
MRKLASLLCIMLMVLTANVGLAQNFWEPANGGTLGDPATLVVANNGTIISAYYNGNIYGSTDNGASWIKANIPEGITSLLKSPNGAIYAQNYAKTYLSADNGSTWVLTSDTLGFSNIDSSGKLIGGWGTQFEVLSRFQSYYLDTLGVRVSSDGGHSWSFTPLYGWIAPYNPGINTFLKSIAFDVDKNGTTFAAISNGEIFKSTDGADWQHVPTDTLTNGAGTLIVTPAGDILVGGNGLYQLDDTAWKRLNYHNASDSTFAQITCNAQGSLFVRTYSYGKLSRSTDNGNSWISLDSSLKDQFVDCLIIDPLKNRIYAGTVPGLQVSADNGDSWHFITHSLASGEIANLNISQSGALIVSTASGIYSSYNLGNTWSPIPFPEDSGDLYLSGWIPFFERNWIYVPSRTGMLRSNDSGASWEAYSSGLPSWVDSNRIKGPFSDNCGNLFLSVDSALSGHMFFSSDFGSSWHESISELPRGTFTSFASDLSCNSYAGGYSGIFRSTDRGVTWKPLNSQLRDTSILVLTFDSAGKFFAVTDSFKIFRSVDNGNSWQYLNRLDSAYPYKGNAFLITDTHGELWLAISTEGYDTGVYRSTNEGVSWDKINSGLIDPEITSLSLSPNGYLFIGTFNNGVFRSVNTIFEAVQLDPTQVASVFLNQNSPNPFPQSTTISFTLPAASYISFNLFDATGREVARIASGYFGAGTHEVPFARGNLPAGVYFYRLVANGSIETRAMVME